MTFSDSGVNHEISQTKLNSIAVKMFNILGFNVTFSRQFP